MALPLRGKPGEDFAEPDRQTLFAQHERWLRTVVFARTGTSDAVDEILQEIALAFFDGDSRPSNLDGIAPWLYRVAVTQSLLYRRKLGRQQRLKHRFTQDTRPTDADRRADDPLLWLLAGERRAMIRQALRRLPRKDAEILLLKYTEDWSYHELSEHLGISTSAVESRLHRARARFRKELTRLQLNEVST
ncbi:MAG: RNA polymerase sigma factor [Planctomycetaceae bacterium]